jgi:hypothetical protein
LQRKISSRRTRRSVRAVQDRAAQARLETSAITAQSAVLVAVVKNLRESRLVVQCAWCGRLGDGDDRWAFVPGVFLHSEQVTGSICRGCLAANSPQPRF